jgi:hypothetical protein
MREDLFQEMMAKANRYEYWEALNALEKLTGREVETLPDGLVTVTDVEAPGVLAPGERVLLHFGGGVTDCGFRPENVVIEVFSVACGEAEAVVRFAFGKVYHEWGEAFHPVRAAVRGTDSVRFAEATHDSRLYHVLAVTDRRVAMIFRALWRLRMGPVLLNARGEIAGAMYS